MSQKLATRSYHHSLKQAKDKQKSKELGLRKLLTLN